MKPRTRAQRLCPFCGSTRAVPLPHPGPRSMRSDGLVLDAPLRKSSCLACGAVSQHAHASSARSETGNYTLNAGAQNRFDLARHLGYADAISKVVGRPPTHVLDVGCGNGGLLRHLARLWPEAKLAGVEPARLPRDSAIAQGLRVASSLRAAGSAELTVSVNVIEHTGDPAAFLRDLARKTLWGARSVVVWPDDAPSTELLFNDHLQTLPSALVRALAARAGLHAYARVPVGGEFQGLAFRRGRPAPHTPLPRQPRHGASRARGRAAYLESWRALDARLLTAVDPTRTLVAFGIGESAQLLRAYAPRSWSRVQALVVDELPGACALGRAVLPVGELDPSRHQLLLATHPRSQPALRERFAPRGLPCISWDDLITR